MIITQVKLQNFGCHASLEAQFSPRMNLIAGCNGAGKSTLVEALCFPLAGVVEGKRQDWRRIGAGDNSSVTLSLEHGGVAVEIEAGLSPSSYKLTVDGKVAADRHREVYLALHEMLGATSNTIREHMFVRQGRMDSWLNETEDGRVRTLSAIVGADKFARIYAAGGDVLAAAPAPEQVSIAEMRAAVAEVRSLRKAQPPIDTAALTAMRAQLQETQVQFSHYRRQLDELRMLEAATLPLRPPLPAHPQLGVTLVEAREGAAIAEASMARYSRCIQAADDNGDVCSLCGRSGADMARIVAGLREEHAKAQDAANAFRAAISVLEGYEQRLAYVRQRRERIRSILRGRKQARREYAPIRDVTQRLVSQLQKLTHAVDLLETEQRAAMQRRHDVALQRQRVLDACLLWRRHRRIWTARAKLQQLRAVFHANAAPKLLIDDYLQRLMVETNNMLGAFEAPFRARQSGAATFDAVFEDGSAVPDYRLSGGQRITLSLAYRLASCLASSLRILVLDEPTAWLDEHHREKFPAAIERMRELSHATGIQVFVVTHDERISSLFDHAVIL